MIRHKRHLFLWNKGPLIFNYTNWVIFPERNVSLQGIIPFKGSMLFGLELVFLNKPSVDDVLKEGMYGPKEIKPEEKRKFLGTFRERVVIALKIGQVTAQKVYPQVEQNIKEHPGAHLLLNGNISYEQLSKYVKLANKYKITQTIVTNKEHETDIGLVLAMDHAVDKENIYVEASDQPLPNSAVKKKKMSLFAKLFRRK